MSPTLGEYLRQERENRGMTVEQVASATKVSVRLLHSLEADQYSELPAKPFIRGFVTAYCRFVGLDPQEVLLQYQGYLDQRLNEKTGFAIEDESYKAEKNEIERSKTQLWAVLAGLIAVGSLIILVFKPALRHKQVSHVQTLQEEYKKTPATEPPAVVTPAVGTEGSEAAASETPAKGGATATEVKSEEVAPKAEEAKLAAASVVPAAVTTTPKLENLAKIEEEKPVEAKPDPLNKGDDLAAGDVKERVLFRTLEDVWVRYQVDQKSVTRFLLKKGKYLSIKGLQAIHFQASNPKSIQYKYRSGTYVTLDQAPTLKDVNDTASALFSRNSQDETGAPFKAESALPGTPDPKGGFQRISVKESAASNAANE